MKHTLFFTIAGFFIVLSFGFYMYTFNIGEDEVMIEAPKAELEQEEFDNNFLQKEIVYIDPIKNEEINYGKTQEHIYTTTEMRHCFSEQSNQKIVVTHPKEYSPSVDEDCEEWEYKYSLSAEMYFSIEEKAEIKLSYRYPKSEGIISGKEKVLIQSENGKEFYRYRFYSLDSSPKDWYRYGFLNLTSDKEICEISDCFEETFIENAEIKGVIAIKKGVPQEDYEKYINIADNIFQKIELSSSI